MRNGIIIPCYNEANRLQFDRFESFISTHENYVLCFVNDGSKDDTLDQISAFAKTNPSQIKVYDMPENSGKAEAVRQGTQYLLETTNVDIIGFMDADLATDFNDFTKLNDLLESENKMMVFGSRKFNQSIDMERSAFREFASKVIGILIKIIIGLDIKDTQCGAKVFNRTTAQYIFKNGFKSRWLFDVEMFIRMRNLYQNMAMDKIQEVPLEQWEEVEGSHITLKDSLKFPLQLIEIGYVYNVAPKLEKFISNIRILNLVRRALNIN